MKYLLVIIIALLNLSLLSGKMVSEQIYFIAKMNYYSCYSVVLEEDEICQPGKYLCELLPGTNDTYTITGIDFSFPAQPREPMEWCLVENFAIFPNITSIYVGSSNNKMRISGSSFLNFGKLPYLKKITIYYSDEFDSTATFPDSLEEVTITKSIGNLPTYFFESKLKVLNIGSVTGTLPILTNQNNYLESLTIGVLADNFGSNISKTFSDNLKSLTDLNIYYFNQSSNSAEAPVLDNYPSLKNLKIDRDSATPVWNFPQSFSQLSNIETLSLGKSVFSFNDSYDFSNLKNNFKFSINDYTSFSYCNSCVSFPYNTTIEIEGDFELASIDFRNVSYFTSKSNGLPQTLPNITETSQLKSFYITDSDIYGTVPSSYCQLPLDFSLTNNQLSDFPACFKCDLNVFNSKILPNPIYLGERDCSTFNLIQITNNNIPTNIGGILQFNGTGLGWEYTIDSETFALDIPNIYFTLSIGKGVGTFEKTIIFNGQDSKTISYKYNAPEISTQDVISIDGTQVFVIYGTNLDYQGTNQATFFNTDSKESIVYSFESQNENNTYITSISADVVSHLSYGTKYQVYLMVGDQQSNTIEFTFNYDNTNSSSESDSEIPSNSSKIILNLNFLLFLLFINLLF